MSGLFIAILNMSFAGSIAVLIVLAVRFLMNIGRLPGRYAYLLWAIPGVRLLWPFIPETGFSLFPAVGKPIEGRIIYAAVPSVDSGLPFFDIPVNAVLEQAAVSSEVTSANPIQIWLALGAAVWLIGCAGFVLINLFQYVRLRRRLRTAVLLEQERKDGGLKVYETETVVSPIAAGFFRPAIYVPFGMEETDLSYVICHENVHIKRKDQLFKLAGFLALAVHWFNPLVWFGYFLMCKDMERACDEKVLDQIGPDCKGEYSAALLKFALRQDGLLIPLAFGESHTKARVKNILRYRKPAPWAGVLITVCIILAGCALSTDPKATTDGDPVIGGADGPAFSAELSDPVSVIGGADGPTSVFVAGKLDGEEEEIPYSPAASQEEPEELITDYSDEEAGLLVCHGLPGIFIYEREGEDWQLAHSIDMKAVDSSYMEEGKDTLVIFAGSGVVVGIQGSEGEGENSYFYDLDSKKLYRDPDLGDFLEAFWQLWKENALPK